MPSTMPLPEIAPAAVSGPSDAHNRRVSRGAANIQQIRRTSFMAEFSSEGHANTDHDLFKGMAKKKKKDSKPSLSPTIQLGDHSRYQIKSGWLAGTFVARAFPKPPTKARGMIAEATGATEEAAIAALHEVIDAREVRRTGERREDRRTGVAVPSVEEYVEAIRQVALSRPQRAMLTALALANGDGLTEMGMASAAGYKSRASVNRAFAAAGLLIASYLSVGTTSESLSSEAEGATLLGYRGERKNEEDPGNWILHAEVREAVRSAL
jgi:hypothetical protein